MRKICTWFLEHIRWFSTFIAILVSAGIFIQLTKNFFHFTFYFSTTRFHIIVIPLFELFLLLAATDLFIHFRKKKGKEFLWQLFFVFFLANTIILFLLTAYYNNFDKLQNPLIDFLLNFSLFIKVVFIVGILFSSWLGFKVQLIQIWKTFLLEDEENIDRKGIRFTIAFLFFFFFVGLGLRLINLAGFPPYVDEYSHTSFAFSLYKGGTFEYTRAFLPVTLPVLISFRIFGVSLWAGRFPMVLINMLSIIPLYALGRRINRIVGYISVALFSLSPWIVAVSRTIREYAIAPIFFFLSAIFLIDLLEWEGISFKQYLAKNKVKILGALFILIYIFFDHQSILKIVVVNYGVFGVLAAVKIIKQNRSGWMKWAIFGVGCILIALMIVLSNVVPQYVLNSQSSFKVTTSFWSMLFANFDQHWYFGLNQIGYVILLIGSFFSIGAIITHYSKSNFTFLFSFMVFTAILLYFTFFLVTSTVPVRTRYGVLLEYWYLIIVAIFLFVVYQVIRFLVKRRNVSNVIFVLFFLGLFTNYQALIKVITYEGGGTLLTTGEKHYIVAPAYKYLVDNLSTNDALFSDLIPHYDEIFGQQLHPLVFIDNGKNINSENQQIPEVIAQYQQGWIALSANARPTLHGLSFASSFIDGLDIRYLGMKGEMYLWTWHKLTQ
jgi:hypothetical protein